MNKRYFSRRDLLKLTALFPVSMAVQPLAKHLNPVSMPGQNIIILVFDAWSAKNIFLSGYKRNTMPNLEKFAERSFVFKNHYANGNFTVPGTASLLTGLHPWEHRALSLGGLIKKEFAENQIFNLLANTHQTIGFAQNVYADQLINQSGVGLNTHIPFGRYNLNDQVFYDHKLFEKDSYAAFNSIENGLLRTNVGVKGSLFINLLNEISTKVERKRIKEKYQALYSSSLPSSIEFYDLANLVDGIIGTLKSIQQPSMVYFHFYTPHAPYSPYKTIFDRFSTDNFGPVRKPDHPLMKEPAGKKDMELARTQYDAYLASWDSELARLFEYFDKSDLRENSHIFITSDHGEEFERGHIGHGEKMMYEPVIKVPLIVSSPGMTSRIDIESRTTNLDLLPTITHLTNNTTPSGISGQLLPGFGGHGNPGRELFILDARLNGTSTPIIEYSLSFHNENFKMIQYQYKEYQETELYDLANDAEELDDLYPSKPAIAERMEKEMVDKMAEINAPFQAKK